MDIHAESLENLLATLREQASPLTPIAALPGLDRGEVIEIQGPASSGKTHLLYHILLSFLVPVSHLAVVVYDTDAAFDIHRFRRLLLSRISTTLHPHETARRALARLHLFRPTSLVQLAASIANLPAYHSSQMPNQEIAVLAIDSVSTFYWPDRLSAEQLRHSPSGSNALVHVLDAVHAVRRSHRSLAILTNWALSPASSLSELLYKQHRLPVIDPEDAIPGPGAKVSNNIDRSSLSPLPLTHRITLSPPSSDPSLTAPLDGMSLQDTRHTEGVVGDGRMLCLTRSFGARNIIRFALQITDDDVLIHP